MNKVAVGFDEDGRVATLVLGESVSIELVAAVGDELFGEYGNAKQKMLEMAGETLPRRRRRGRVHVAFEDGGHLVRLGLGAATLLLGTPVADELFGEYGNAKQRALAQEGF